MKFLAWMFFIHQLFRCLFVVFPNLDWNLGLDPQDKRAAAFLSSLIWIIVSVIIIF